MHDEHRSFYKKLAALLSEYNAELTATDDDKPYGQHLPLLRIEFQSPYRSDEFANLSANDCRQLAETETD